MENNSKRKIYILTNGFPYGDSEKSFLQQEAECLQEYFNAIFLPYNYGEKEGGEDFKVMPFHKPGIWRKIKCMLKSFVQPAVWKEFYRCYREKDRNVIKFIKVLLLYNFNANIVSEFLADYILHEEEEGIVYSYWYSELCLGAVRLKKRFPRYSFVTRTHGCDLYDERTALHYQPFKYEMDNLLDLVIFAAESSKNYYLNRYKLADSSKYYVSRIGSGNKRMVRYIPRHEKLVLLSCSSIITLKRIPLIIDALSLIPEKYEIIWFHVGGGAIEKEVIEYAKKLDTSSNIIYNFLGSMQHDEYLNWMEEQSIDIFVTASSTEGGCPVSIAEALSFGIPVIGTAVGGIPEMLAYQNGILVEENPSAAELKDAILEYAGMTEYDKYRMHQNALKAWEKDFNSLKTSKMLAKVMKTI